MACEVRGVDEAHLAPSIRLPHDPEVARGCARTCTAHEDHAIFGDAEGAGDSEAETAGQCLLAGEGVHAPMLPHAP